MSKNNEQRLPPQSIESEIAVLGCILIDPKAFPKASQDINQDSLINIQDIILLIYMILSQETNESADVNFDGNVDILDAVVLVNMILQPQ